MGRSQRQRFGGKRRGGVAPNHPKSIIQSRFVARRTLSQPTADFRSTGPPHAPVFECRLRATATFATNGTPADTPLYAVGEGANKKDAERIAYENLVVLLEGNTAAAAPVPEDTTTGTGWDDDEDVAPDPNAFVPAASSRVAAMMSRPAAPGAGSAAAPKPSRWDGLRDAPAPRRSILPPAPQRGGIYGPGGPGGPSSGGGGAKRPPDVRSRSGGPPSKKMNLGDTKGLIMGYLQRKRLPPPRTSWRRSGPSHHPMHELTLVCRCAASSNRHGGDGDGMLQARGISGNKKHAEMEAYADLLEQMTQKGYLTAKEARPKNGGGGGGGGMPTLTEMATHKGWSGWNQGPEIHPEEAINILSLIHRNQDGPEPRFEMRREGRSHSPLFAASIRMNCRSVVEAAFKDQPHTLNEMQPQDFWFEGSAQVSKKKDACHAAATDLCHRLLDTFPKEMHMYRSVLKVVRDGVAVRELRLPISLLQRMTGLEDQTRRLQEECRDDLHGDGGRSGGSGNSFGNRFGSRVAAPADLERRSSDLQARQKAYDATTAGRVGDLRAGRQRLPAFAQREQLVDAISNNRAVVIVGDTGCGKSTQLPQFVLEEYSRRGFGAQCNVIVTQPRRVAAVSIAHRVAAERGETVGDTVGFSVRLDKRPPRDDGGILFCTTGVLLQRLRAATESSQDGSIAKDEPLQKITHVFIDEAHERSLDSDFLLSILIQKIPDLPNLRIIVMSATIQSDRFSEYLGSAPVLEVPGRTFPVDAYFLEDLANELPRDSNYAIRSAWMESQDPKGNNRNRGEFSPNNLPYQAMVDALVHLHCTRMGPGTGARGDAAPDAEGPGNTDGAILVFLPGWNEIETTKNLLLERLAYMRLGDSVTICVLHSNMSMEEQQMAFQRPRPGCRKIVLSTNIAETSVTIDDVVYVVDSCLVRENVYDASRNTSALLTQFASLASLRQRRGRAGRVQRGIVFHMIPRQMAESNLPKEAMPEIQRVPLESMVLKAIALGLAPVTNFALSLIDPPDRHRLFSAVQRLEALRALNVRDDKEVLTPIGRWMSTVPLDPPFAKMVLLSSFFGVLEPMLLISASLSLQSSNGVFMRPRADAPDSEKAEAKECRNYFAEHVLTEGGDAESAVGPRGLGSNGDARSAGGQFAAPLPVFPNAPRGFYSKKVDCNRADQLTTLNAIRAWRTIADREGRRSSMDFCRAQWLSHRNMDQLLSIRRELARTVQSSLPSGSVVAFLNKANRFEKTPEEDPLLRGVLCGGLYPNVAVLLSSNDKQLLTPEGELSQFHPSSVNYSIRGGCDSPYFAFVEKATGNNSNMPLLKGTCNVGTHTMALFGASLVPHPMLPGILLPRTLLDDLYEDRGGYSTMSTEARVVFKGSPHVAQAILMLQEALDALMIAEAMGKEATDLKDQVCRVIVEFLTIREGED